MSQPNLEIYNYVQEVVPNNETLWEAGAFDRYANWKFRQQLNLFVLTLIINMIIITLFADAQSTSLNSKMTSKIKVY